VIPHIAGVPIEEALAALLSGIGAGLLLKLTSASVRVRRPRSPRRDRRS
jgi:hypothetical protein